MYSVCLAGSHRARHLLELVADDSELTAHRFRDLLAQSHASQLMAVQKKKSNSHPRAVVQPVRDLSHCKSVFSKTKPSDWTRGFTSMHQCCAWIKSEILKMRYSPSFLEECMHFYFGKSCSSSSLIHRLSSFPSRIYCTTLREH